MTHQLWFIVLLAVSATAVKLCDRKAEVLTPSPYYPRFSVDMKAECNKRWEAGAERTACVVVANQVTAFYANNMDNPEAVLETIHEKLVNYVATNTYQRSEFLKAAKLKGADKVTDWGTIDELKNCFIAEAKCKWCSKAMAKNSNGVPALVASLTKMCATVAEKTVCNTMTSNINNIISGSASDKAAQIAVQLKNYMNANVERIVMMSANYIEGIDEKFTYLSFVMCQAQGECPLLTFLAVVDPRTEESLGSIMLREACKTYPQCPTVVNEFKRLVHDPVDLIPAAQQSRLEKAQEIVRSAGMGNYLDSMIDTWGTIGQMLSCHA